MPTVATPRADRCHYIDWLRVLAITLLLPAHSAAVFSPLPFYHVKNDVLSSLFVPFLGFLEPWLVPLLFVTAGWAASRSLERRTWYQFLADRATKLLLPLLVGSALFGPLIKYIELRSGFDVNYLSACERPSTIPSFGPCIPSPPTEIPSLDGGFLAFWPTFFTDFARFTWSHLWFLGYLFAFSLLYLPLFLWLERSQHRPGNLSSLYVYVPVVPLVSGELILRARWPGLQNLHYDWANFTFYSVCMVSGFLLARYPPLEEGVSREWRRAFCISLVGWVVRLVVWLGLIDCRPLMSAGTVLAGWSFVVMLLGLGRVHLARSSPLLHAARKLAFPVYFFHQPILVLFGYWIVRIKLGIAAKYVLLLTTATAATLGMQRIVAWADKRVCPTVSGKGLARHETTAMGKGVTGVDTGSECVRS